MFYDFGLEINSNTVIHVRLHVGYLHWFVNVSIDKIYKPLGWNHSNKVFFQDLVLGNKMRRQSKLSHEKNPGCLGYIGDYTTQLYRDYNKPL